MIKQLIKLRQELHKNPELSAQEFETQKRIKKFFEKLNPNKIIEFEGMTGIAFVFEGKKSSDPFERVGTIKNMTIMFRADLDAVAVKEKSDIKYKSINEGIAHSCGHDGHMTILSGLGMKISKNRLKNKRVILLFQPAEEAEDGARRLINHKTFKEIEPDFVFGLHNIPGYKKNSVILKKNNFTSASKGLIIKLIGKTSHASEPEKGINPLNAVQHIINQLNKHLQQKKLYSDWFLISFMYIKIGEINYGISPGEAEIIVSLRAYTNEDLTKLTQNCENIVNKIAENEKLQVELSEKEYYPSVVNNDEGINIIRNAAKDINLKIIEKQEPFPWAEDFSYFCMKYKAAFFGLGSGTKQPKLHNANYNFPDEIIETGVELFYRIYKEC